jgi:hypothetical protein
VKALPSAAHSASSLFNQAVLGLLDAVPDLGGDPDLNATNEGVTVVWLR